MGATFPLERAADAHRALEAGEVTGKAVLTMDSCTAFPDRSPRAADPHPVW
ncbi:MAG TPA: zinc-binding dehydrogenase [Trebonia sp.]|nr:zinc-binding dehydrogenase [Trebonia sp.]